MLFLLCLFALKTHLLSDWSTSQSLWQVSNQIANPFKYVYFCNIISATMTLPAVAAIEGVVSPVVVYDLDARLSLTIRSLISNNSILKEMKRLVSKEKQPKQFLIQKYQFRGLVMLQLWYNIIVVFSRWIHSCTITLN